MAVEEEMAPTTLEDARAKKEKAAREIIAALQLDIDFKVNATYQKRLGEMFFNNLNRMSWEALDWFRFALLNDLGHTRAQQRAAKKLAGR